MLSGGVERGTAAARLGKRALHDTLQLARPAGLARLPGGPIRIDAVWLEMFNLFNVTNVLGTSNRELLRLRERAGARFERSSESRIPAIASQFGTPVSTAGGVFGSGGPRPAARRPCQLLDARRTAPDRHRTCSGLWSATALVVGHTIAVGIFLTPAELIGALASPVLTLGLWVVCGALVLAGAFTFGELAARYPLAGGPYVYLQRSAGANGSPSSMDGSRCW